MTAVLELTDVHAGYGPLSVLKGIDLDVHEGEVVSVLGPNGAGKTTLLRTIAGLISPSEGTILLEGQDITALPAHERVPAGIALVPEGRDLFPFLTVVDNLRMGAYHPEARARREESLEWVYELFPLLRDRPEQLAGSLSGGEQQMCAIARGLMSRPKVLMLDEPSLGLAPIIVSQVFELLARLRDEGLTILLVEQNVAEALEISSRGNVVEQGRLVMSGTSDELLHDEQLRAAYFGPA